MSITPLKYSINLWIWFMHVWGQIYLLENEWDFHVKWNWKKLLWAKEKTHEFNDVYPSMSSRSIKSCQK